MIYFQLIWLPLVQVGPVIFFWYVATRCLKNPQCGPNSQSPPINLQLAPIPKYEAQPFRIKFNFHSEAAGMSSIDSFCAARISFWLWGKKGAGQHPNIQMDPGPHGDHHEPCERTQLKAKMQSLFVWTVPLKFGQNWNRCVTFSVI
jgi:hypothetical protein